MQMQTEYEKHFHVQLLLNKCADVIAMLMQRVIVQVTIVTIAVIRIASRRPTGAWPNASKAFSDRETVAPLCSRDLAPAAHDRDFSRVKWTHGRCSCREGRDGAS